jgi:hypothetical protein
MVTKPGLAENERKRIFGGSAFKNCGRHWNWAAKQEAPPMPTSSKEKTA